MISDMKKFFYRVQSGDDVFSVSRKFLVPVGRIIFLNGLKKEIEEGDLLYIEKGDYRVYSVKAGDNLESLAQKFGVSKEAIKSVNSSSYVFFGEIIYIP